MIAVGGCASFSTIQDDDPGKATRDGLVYFLPQRDFKFTVSVDDKGVQTATVAAADTIPDLSHRFVLAYNRNYVGSNHAAITINAKGLLQTSNATTTSGADALAKAVGTLAGDVRAAFVTPPGPKAQTCQKSQTYTALVAPGKPIPDTPLCDFVLSGVRVADKDWAGKNSARLNSGRAEDGVFYKHDLPYKLTIRDTVNNTTSTYQLYSPTESEIAFVPVSHSFLATTQTNVTLSEGSLMGVDQSSDGELVALLQFPATVVSAYFTAVGGIFSSRSTIATDQSNLIAARQGVAVAQVKSEACKAAITANDPGSKTGEALTTAVANIKAACQ